MGHGVCDLQNVEEIDGCSSRGGRFCRYVGGRCVAVSGEGCGLAANSKSVVYLRQC